MSENGEKDVVVGEREQEGDEKRGSEGNAVFDEDIAELALPVKRFEFGDVLSFEADFSWCHGGVADVDGVDEPVAFG